MLLKYIADLNKNNPKYMIKSSINGDTNNLHISIRKKIDNIEILHKVFNLSKIEKFEEFEKLVISVVEKVIKAGD